MRSVFTVVAVVLGVLALVVYVVVGETGPIGWINAGQMWLVGSYSRKISMLVLIALVGIPCIALWSVVSPASLSGRPTGTTTMADTSGAGATGGVPTSMLGIALGGWAVFMVLVWAGSYGYAAWQLHERNADAGAAYVPLELAADLKMPPAADHLALRGRVLGEHTVSRSEGSDSGTKTILVPVVERGWREGDAVRFVMQLDGAGQSALRNAPRGDALLVRTDGSVPTAARQVFTRMKAPLAADAMLLALVPSAGGRPAAGPTELDTSDVVLWGVIGSIAVTLFFVFFAAAPVLSARQGRKDAARRLRQAQR